jgi:Holliday junction resolvasome RuvABC endonuclease subunit
MLLNQTWLIIYMNLFMLKNNRLSIIVLNMYTTVYIVQNRMKELLPNDSAATSSITDGTIRWAPGDAYALAMDNKLEYAGRVRGIGSGIQPVKGSTVKYYTPATRSQTTLQSVVDEQKKLIEEQRMELIEIREQLATQQAQAAAQLAQAEAQALAKEQAYDARFSMLESFMRASVGTSHIFNNVQENQSTQAMVRSSVASRPGNSINWYIFSHLLRSLATMIVWLEAKAFVVTVVAFATVGISFHYAFWMIKKKGIH